MTTTRRGGRWRLLATCAAGALVLVTAGCATGSPALPWSGATSASASTLPPPPVDFPWVASVTATERPGEPRGDTVWVTTDAATGTRTGGSIVPAFTAVDVQSDSSTTLLGWYGADRRTLVWETGQDLTSLRSATFSATGRIVAAAAPLAIPGAVTTYGYGFAQPDGSLVWVRLTRTQPAWEMVVLDSGLHVTARYAVPLSGEGTPQFATVTSVGVRTSPTSMSVWISGIGTTEATLPSQCTEETSGTPPLIASGGEVWMRCAGVLVVLDSLMSGNEPVTATPALPDGSAVVGAWFDRAALPWVSSGTGADARTWRFAPSPERTWAPADVQGVLARTYVGELSLTMHADASGATLGTWRSETTPAVQVAPTIPRAGAEGLVLAVRPIA